MYDIQHLDSLQKRVKCLEVTTPECFASIRTQYFTKLQKHLTICWALMFLAERQQQEKSSQLPTK